MNFEFFHLKKRKHALLPSYQGHRRYLGGSVNALAGVMGPPVRCSTFDAVITFRWAAR